MASAYATPNRGQTEGLWNMILHLHCCEALALLPVGHSERPVTTMNLAVTLTVNFGEEGRTKDLQGVSRRNSYGKTNREAVEHVERLRVITRQYPTRGNGR
jgi:hypothetical protein